MSFADVIAELYDIRMEGALKQDLEEFDIANPGHYVGHFHIVLRMSWILED